MREREPKTDQAWRVTRTLPMIVLIVLVGFALFSNLHFLIKTLQHLPMVHERDWVTIYDRRYTELRMMLPPNATVGYIGHIADRDNEWVAFHLTQYALAPVLVSDSTDKPLIVGNFQRHDFIFTALERHPNLYLIRDFGAGVLLFGNRNK